jgi:hypothetical protein
MAGSTTLSTRPIARAAEADKGATGQHHVERGRCADQPGQAHAAAPARIDAQLDLRQRDARRRIVGGHPMAAGEGEFGAAAHAVAMDGRDGGTAEFGQPLEHLLPAPERVGDRALRVEGLEFADVGPGDEAGRLGRTDDQAFRRVQGEALDDGVEFQQHLLRQRIHALSGAIEAQHDDAVGRFGTPVREPQTVQPCEHARPSDGVRESGYDPGGV